MNCILINPNQIQDQQFAIINNQAQIAHLIQVLKVTHNDWIKIAVLNQGMGRARVWRMEQDQIVLQLQDLTPPPKKLDLTVILALPRPKVLRRLILDMTAMGVQNIILVNSIRTEKSYWQSPLLQKMDDFVAEGLQQAMDCVAPKIVCKQRLKPFVEDELPNLIDRTCQKTAVIAHPYAAQTWQAFLYRSNDQDNQADKIRANLPNLICIGAEGGWIDYEVDLFQKHGCQAVSFGHRILRTEAMVNAWLGWWLI